MLMAILLVPRTHIARVPHVAPSGLLRQVLRLLLDLLGIVLLVPRLRQMVIAMFCLR